MKYEDFKVGELYHDYMHNDDILIAEITDRCITGYSQVTRRIVYIWHCIYDENRFDEVKEND